MRAASRLWSVITTAMWWTGTASPAWMRRFTRRRSISASATIPAYLLIQPVVNGTGGTITFNFYGTKPDRQVTISEPEIADVSPPPEPLYEVDESLALDERRQVDWAKEGMTVTVRVPSWRTVKRARRRCAASTSRGEPSTWLAPARRFRRRPRPPPRLRLWRKRAVRRCRRVRPRPKALLRRQRRSQS